MIVLAIIGVIIVAVFILYYIDGYWTISTTKEVERSVYDMYSPSGKCKGQETRIVYQITYLSGRIEFKEKKYRH